MSNFWQVAKNHHGVKAKTEWEYRLYYNDDGTVNTYSTDAISGNYIVVSQSIFAQNRYDVVVKNGQVYNPNLTSQVRKLVPSDQGTETLADDITIIGPGQKWKLRYYDTN
jgi:hypothetical protein